jgi:NADPH:quinone reductase-like Zn-dependent oxidoreductase
MRAARAVAGDAPPGQDSDLAGVVVEVGPQVSGVAVGDEVLGFTHHRASHAEFVVVDDVALTSRPVGLPRDVAGSLYAAGTTAYATVFAVDPDRPTRSSSPVRRRVACRAVRAAARRRGVTVIGRPRQDHRPGVWSP